MDNLCNGHGNCTIAHGIAATCTCDFGWTLSANCRVPLDIILIGVLVVVSLLTGLGSQVFCHRINRLRSQAQTAYTLLLTSASARLRISPRPGL